METRGISVKAEQNNKKHCPLNAFLLLHTGNEKICL